MIRVKYQAKDYEASQVVQRYARINHQGEISWCEVGGKRNYDIRQGTADKHDLPPQVLESAEKNTEKWPSYVAWPFE